MKLLLCSRNVLYLIVFWFPRMFELSVFGLKLKSLYLFVRGRKSWTKIIVKKQSNELVRFHIKFLIFGFFSIKTTIANWEPLRKYWCGLNLYFKNSLTVVSFKFPLRPRLIEFLFNVVVELTMKNDSKYFYSASRNLITSIFSLKLWWGCEREYFILVLLFRISHW